MKLYKKTFTNIISIALFFIAIFLSVYKLNESPPTWMDEGIIIQTARSIADIGRPAIIVAPGKYESAGIVTTSYTVTGLVAASFKLFGAGLIQARIVMVIYLLLFFCVLYFIFKKYISPNYYILSFALLVSFAPLYGQGKNVLGEVPGMFFFILFLFAMYFIEKGYVNKSILPYIIGSLVSGLFVITKPIFILFIPAIFISFIIKKFWLPKNDLDFFTKNNAFQFSIAFLLPIIIWFLFQFSGDSIKSIFSLYANPYSIDIKNVVLSNIKLLFSDFQPFYFLCLFIIWLISITLRLYKKENIFLAELVSFFFSALIFAAFFRTPGFYRYFFPAQVLTLLYLVSNLNYIGSRFKFLSDKKRSLFVMTIATFLIIFQSYGLLFTSWTAKSYNSTRSQKMQEYFSKIPSKNIFLYQAPEVATFLPISSFYQFFFYAPGRSVGKESLIALSDGVPDIVIVNSDVYKENIEKFYRYGNVEVMDRYNILRK